MYDECYCDYDPPAFYKEEIRRARKPHKCDECGGTISVGEQYEHVWGKWEGYVAHIDTCERCRDIYQWTRNNVPCVCKVHGNLIEECEDAIDAATFRVSEETVGLRFGFLRRKVLRDKFNARCKG